MKNREKDVPYCGVREDVIRNAKPKLNEENVLHLYEFFTERHKIFKKKEVDKLPAPWTDNQIFQTVKFTNVFRELDRESRNVINGICKQTQYSLKDRCFNIILMRFWNKWESFRLATGGNLINFPMSDEDFNACNARIEANVDHTWWSSAYYTCPVRSFHERILLKGEVPTSEINFSQSPIFFAKHILTDKLWDDIIHCESPEKVFELLTSIPWMGKFLVYQWWVDFTYNDDYPFSENEYTVSGPGCTRGLDLIFKDRDGMTYEECLFWLRDNQYLIFTPFGYDPQSLFDDRDIQDRKLGLMSLENLHCELQKYIKQVELIKQGKKPRGKNKYDGMGKSNKKQVNLFDFNE